MCLLTYFPPNIEPNEERLVNGATYNDDGHGWAIVTNGQIIEGKSLDSDEAIAAFVAMRRSFPTGPAMFHSRWSTGGTVDVANCHPFHVGSDRRTVIAHNGVIFTPTKNERRSDTRIMAETIIPKKYPHLWTKPDRKQLSSRLGPTNKVVILTANPRYAKSAYIIGESQGIWDEGVWYSNSGYKPYVTTPRYGYWWDDDGAWEKIDGRYRLKSDWRYGYRSTPCVLCGAIYAVQRDLCEECLTCQDCLMGVEACQCWPGRQSEPPMPYIFNTGQAGKS